MQNDLWQTIWATLSSILIFIVLMFVVSWPFWVAIPLSVGTFFGVYFITKPAYKIGQIKLDDVAESAQARELLLEADKDMRGIQANIPRIKNPEIKQNAQTMYNTGANIMNYLMKNPEKISPARRFLTYYLETADELLRKYLAFQDTNLKTPETQKIEAETASALPILNKAFEQQFVNLMKNEMMDIETDIEVLKTTLKMEDTP